MEYPKVIITIKFKTDKEVFTGESEMIDWKYPMPSKGDCFDLFSESMELEFIFPSREDREAIKGNIFPYQFKDYIFTETGFVLVFRLGDW